MSGTVSGGKATAATNKRKYGKDFYRGIALLAQESWDANGRKPRGFATMSPEQRRLAGIKGGTISRRNKQKTNKS